MASTKNRTKSQTKKSQVELLVPVLSGVIAVLMLIVGCLVWKLNCQSPHKPYAVTEKIGSGFVSLGSLGFRFEGNKAIARHDASVKEIREFLKKENERSGCKDNNGAVSVIAYSQDEKQLLLGSGCGNTLARMFAVKKDDGWKAISPTNQFNLFEVPSCKMTDENNISKEIAPVCQNESRAAENAPLTYSYRVR